MPVVIIARAGRVIIIARARVVIVVDLSISIRILFPFCTLAAIVPLGNSPLLAPEKSAMTLRERWLGACLKQATEDFVIHVADILLEFGPI